MTEENQEPLPPLLPPEGVVASRLLDVASVVHSLDRGRVDISGARGCFGPALVAAAARRGRQIVLVVEDLDVARRSATDVAFFLGSGREDAEETGEGDVLVLGTSESSPFATISPDRLGAMNRLATLSHLASARPWRVLVVTGAALVRKVVPRADLAKRNLCLSVDSEVDREKFLRELSEAGYLRVPIVEDPGNFAVRGALIDVWPPSNELPVRIELYGDLILSLSPFDPTEQKTSRDAVAPKSLWLPPVREAILAPTAAERARSRVVELAEAMNYPTSKTRALAEDVASGRAFFGADGFLPAYYDQLDPIFAYVHASILLVIDNPPAVVRAVRQEVERAVREHGVAAGSRPTFPVDALYGDEAEATEALTTRPIVLLHRLPVAGPAAEGLAALESLPACPTVAMDRTETSSSHGKVFDVASSDQQELTHAVNAARLRKGKSAGLEPLVRRVHYWHDHGMRVLLTARAHSQAERLAMLLRNQGVLCRRTGTSFDPSWFAEASQTTREVEIVVGALTRGGIVPADARVIATEEEIFGARWHRRRAAASRDDPARPFLKDLRTLAVGDYVVHTEHGIGRYQGLVHKTVSGITVDLLVVEYAAGDKLYLPVWRLSQLEKYVGTDGVAPKLDRLGGSTFARSKARVAAEVRKLADELLQLYAQRRAAVTAPLAPCDDDYRGFEATFPFDETPDQSRAIDDVNRDLESGRPMDRLVCGDVGFGKTEVALRAAFRVVAAGKQVAVLCPTTVLAQQHLRTFEARLSGYPFAIKPLSRFQSKKVQDETLAALKAGKVDILIGTHRLLSKDVHFRDLRLLVVDEEQRFGVTHKERIKQLRAHVDVLTLTATPIPRTLQMAVTGLRDLSLITTAPVDRRAVRTLVTQWDPAVVREAVERELSRGGQVFYVYNRVEKLHEKARLLQELVVAARIIVLHGQMSEAVLEESMLDFVDGRYDILVSTAIVESGLDIPRANTMIIDRADLMGLAQLYQLRGRVGRSSERAYCYLVVPPPSAMSDEARARIEALERNTELGSGFQIASLDREMRGAGDLLGGEQSGNLASVGFEMFCQMLDDAVHELRGESIVHEIEPELNFDVEALLPEAYVSDVGIRLSLYKRLASAHDEAHVAEIANEMEDRFGPPPEDAKQLVRLMSLKTELRRLRVLGCDASGKLVRLYLRDDTPLDAGKIAALVRRSPGLWRISPDMRIWRRFEPEARKGTPRDGLEATEIALSELVPLLP